MACAGDLTSATKDCSYSLRHPRIEVYLCPLSESYIETRSFQAITAQHFIPVGGRTKTLDSLPDLYQRTNRLSEPYYTEVCPPTSAVRDIKRDVVRR